MDNDNFNDLEKKIADYKSGKDTREQADSQKAARNKSIGLRAGAELVVNPVLGAFIGLFLDRWLDTKPVFLIIFLLLGCGAGFLNVYKITQNMGTSVGFKPLPNDKKEGKNEPGSLDQTDKHNE